MNDKVYKNRWIMLITIVLVTFMSTLDGSIVNVALPNMSDELNVSMAQIEWVVTSFLITIAATILIFGRLGDIKGKINIFKFGLILFTLGSLLCGFTNSLPVLVAARIIQAIGASATMATNQGIITQVFPANERGRALGTLGSFVALGAMTGPPLGGFIVSAFSWKYIFLVNVPIGIIIFILVMKLFPKATVTINESLDTRGSSLFVIATVALFAALVEGQSVGYNNAVMISAFIISALAFIAFILIEKKLKEPLLDLSMFSNSLFSISILCAMASFIAISASNIILPFYFQDALKFSASKAGLFMMVSPIVLSVVAPFSGYMSDKIGSEILTFFGLIVTSLGLILISTLTERSSVISIVLYIVIMTIGNGMFQSPNNSLVMSTVSKNKLGIAGSINALVRNFGMVLGTSLATLILYNRMSYRIGHRVVDYVPGRPDVFMYGMSRVYIFAAVICMIGAIMTAFRLYRSKKNKKNENYKDESLAG
ncbi:MFS transporter [Clostridium oryzae]|uniref:Multidrug resistance protein Stp n=1 Tax=Clostridium oryzae TaxID=1450648 RepID=A0A1V4IBP3_9CLOT|nr:MFS transporter [Clostridium oryzae]OPJ57422.1 multidrug resistance protein Stp [Clostridium oryzae]